MIEATKQLSLFDMESLAREEAARRGFIVHPGTGGDVCCVQSRKTGIGSRAQTWEGAVAIMTGQYDRIPR